MSDDSCAGDKERLVKSALTHEPEPFEAVYSRVSDKLERFEAREVLLQLWDRNIVTPDSDWNYRLRDTGSEHGGDKIEGEHITELHEFLDDMGSNPLGDGQRVRQVGRYVVEYYADTFTIDDRVRPRLQIFRRVHDDEEHFRDWKHIANDDDFEVDDIAELWKTITEGDIDEVVDDG